MKNVYASKQLEQMETEGFVPSSESLLCSDHFEKCCFNIYGNIQLKRDAVPSIFASRNCDGKKRAHSPTHAIANTHVKHKTEVQPAEALHSGTENTPAHNSINKEIVCSLIVPNNPAIDAFAQCNDSPNTSQTISHDHRYASTPRTARNKLNRAYAKIREMKTSLKQKNKKIYQMKNRISTLKNIVIKVREKKALPESGLACLDSIAESDVSQFLKRFENNAKRTQARQFSPKKRPSKAQRKSQSHSARNKFSISREKYPPALRSSSMTLHFYSPKAKNFAMHYRIPVP